MYDIHALSISPDENICGCNVRIDLSKCGSVDNECLDYGLLTRQPMYPGSTPDFILHTSIHPSHPPITVVYVNMACDNYAAGQCEDEVQ